MDRKQFPPIGPGEGEIQDLQIKRFANDLKADDPSLRHLALASLGELGNPQAIPVIEQALRDEEPAIREAAAEFLVQLGWEAKSPTDLAYFYAAIGDWGEATSLGLAAAPAMLPILDRYVTYEDPHVRKNVIQRIVEIGDPNAIGTLRQFLNDEDWDLSMAALAAIVELSKKIKDKKQPVANEYVDALFDALYEPHIQTEEEVLEEISKALWRLKAPLKNLGGILRSNGSVKAALAVHPEWLQDAPDKDDLIKYRNALSYLPPVGGKIPIVYKGDPVDILVPSLTAEEQAQAVTSLRKKGSLGEVYVHQLTVQGRLPDEFKFAALALILSSPYKNDWDRPFFEAPWGKIAPLVHDGGNVDHGVNAVWSDVKGRTDFLQRIAFVHRVDVEQLERLKPGEVAKLPVETLSSARNEQAERERLTLEAKAYQRLALALHARAGTAPKRIPEEVRSPLADHWVKFEETMTSILGEYGLRAAADVTWFNAEPRPLAHLAYGPRHEADWQPIKETLLQLEGARPYYPELRNSVVHLLKGVTDSIDRTIGFIPENN